MLNMDCTNLKRPPVARMRFFSVYRQKISHVTELSRDAQKFVHPSSENGTCPAAEVHNQRTVSSAEVQQTTA